MRSIAELFGGRKVFVGLLVVALTILNEIFSLGWSEEAIWALVGTGAATSGAVALEDGLKGLKKP